ncbi:MAG: hypothetical protein GX368_05730 [Erysipelotrichaceae bacterium]|nr:hypothetical protein [Erysipelotrichaceae bacterium]
MENLVYKINGKDLEVTYEELIENNKSNMYAGVALAYKLLNLLISFNSDLSNINYFFSGIGENGKGVIDTINYVFNNSVTIDLNYDVLNNVVAPDAPNGGKYYFIFKGNKEIRIKLKESLINEEFIKISREVKKYKVLPNDLEVKLLNVRKNQEKAVLGLIVEEIFDWEIV